MKKTIRTENAPAAIGPYSQGVGAGGFLYVSGQLPLDPETGQFAAQDIKGQTKRSIKNIAVILAAEGAGLGDIVKTTVFLKNIDDFAGMNEVYAEYFGDENCPARSTVEVSALPKGALVEIEAIAFAG